MINVANMPKAYSEVYCFLNALGENYKNKIPDSIYNTIKENRDFDYNPIFTSNQIIEKNMISKEGIAIISALNFQYWATEEEKIELKNTYINNEKLLKEQYSYNNIFNSSNTNEATALIEYKESWTGIYSKKTI